MSFIKAPSDGDNSSSHNNSEAEKLPGHEETGLKQVSSFMESDELSGNHNGSNSNDFADTGEAGQLSTYAEEMKEAVHKQLRMLKSRFRLLKHRNLEIPLSIRFVKDDFFIDDRPGAKKRAFNEEKLIEYYRAQEFDSAKQFVLMKKIQDYFLNIEAHYLVVKDLQHSNQISTFRLKSPNVEFWKILEQNRKLIDDEESLKTEICIENIIEMIEPVKRYFAKDLIGDFEGKLYNVTTIHAIKSLEKRLEKRYKRECEWAKLDSEKIPDDWAATEDISALKEAEDTLGDYKLKNNNNNNFIGKGITTAQRRQRILNLKLEMHELKMKFNTLVYLLKDEKPGLIQECRQLIQMLRRLQQYLPPKLRQPLPLIYDLESSEEPNQLFDISGDAIEAKIEEKVTELGFQEQKETIQKKVLDLSYLSEELPKSHETPSVYKLKSFNLEIDVNLEDAPRPTQDVLKSLICRTFSPKLQLLPPKPSGTKNQSFDGLHASVFRYRQLCHEDKLEQNGSNSTNHNSIILKRKFQQQTLHRKLQQKLNYYENRMLTLIDEKRNLVMNLKMMEIAILNDLEELDIAKHFDEEEHTIEEKIKNGRIDLLKIKEKRLKMKWRLEKANQDVESIQTEMKQNHSETASVIGENHRFVEYLWKLFRTNTEIATLGHVKLHTESQDSISASHEEINGNINIHVSHSKPSQSKQFASVSKAPQIKYDFIHCPVGLEHAKFDKVLELGTRERRLRVDLESRRRVLNHMNKHFHEMEVNYTEKETKLASLADEFGTLQRRKQQRINNIDKIVLVKAHQIQCLHDDDELDVTSTDLEERILSAFPSPKDILAVSSGVTELLEDRAEELKIETQIQHDKLRQARRLVRRVKEELLKKEKSIIGLERACNENMIKKFGRLVDLDQISGAIINLQLVNALSKLELRRNEHFNEQFELKRETKKIKEKLMGVTKINSELNTLVAILEERQRDIEYYMHLQGKDENQIKKEEIRDQTVSEITESRELGLRNEDMYDELDELDEIIWTQEMKIGVLRSVITVCKTKEGVPPLIPLKTLPKDHDIGRLFVTYQEIQHFRENKNKDVITLYKKEQMTDKLEKSNSEIPFHQHQQDYNTNKTEEIDNEQNEHEDNEDYEEGEEDEYEHMQHSMELNDDTAAGETSNLQQLHGFISEDEE